MAPAVADGSRPYRRGKGVAEQLFGVLDSRPLSATPVLGVSNDLRASELLMVRMTTNSTYRHFLGSPSDPPIVFQIGGTLPKVRAPWRVGSQGNE